MDRLVVWGVNSEHCWIQWPGWWHKLQMYESGGGLEKQLVAATPPLPVEPEGVSFLRWNLTHCSIQWPGMPQRRQT